ncbi:MAG: hypothetical protein WDZ93_03000 [Candidatus Paceibacterota bacterium]
MTTQKLGIQVVEYVVAEKGGTAEQIIQELANQYVGGENRFSRSVGPWHRSKEYKCDSCELIIRHGTEVRKFTLLLGAPALNDSQKKATLYLRTASVTHGRFSLKKGEFPSVLSSTDLKCAVSMLTAALGRGRGWVNGSGDRQESPYGPNASANERKRKRKLSGWHARRERERHYMGL